jgi:hypothetical protein
MKKFLIFILTFLFLIFSVNSAFALTPTPTPVEEISPTTAPKTTGSSAVQVPTTSSSSPTVAMVKKMALQPINNMLKDFQFLVAPILAMLLFSAFSFIFFIFFFFNFISGGFVKIIFYILEKTGFIHFEKEMREVQTLVV